MTERPNPEAHSDSPPGTPGKCAQHPQTPAAYVCDGCRNHLCTACIDEGHRLKMCKLCGEMALPLGREFGVEDRFHRMVRNPVPDRTGPPPEISVGAALRFPFRGRGTWLFSVYLVVAVLLELLSAVVLFQLVLIPFFVALPLLVGSLFLRIIRTTAAGSDEMPDWPDWDLQERLDDVLKLASVLLVATIPVLVALLAAGCFGSETPPRCVIAALIGSAGGALFALVALGAVAIYDDLAAAFRLDLHAQAIRVFGWNLPLVIAFLMALFLLGGAVTALVAQMPIFAGLLGLAVTTYCTFLAAYLVGLLFRRHETEIVAIYLG